MLDYSYKNSPPPSSSTQTIKINTAGPWFNPDKQQICDLLSCRNMDTFISRHQDDLSGLEASVLIFILTSPFHFHLLNILFMLENVFVEHWDITQIL